MQDAILKHWQAPQSFKLLTPKTSSAAALFFFAWYSQNKCHRYLASLKKYTLPEQGPFRYLVCPHYTYECLLYVALAMAAAPQGKLFNKTLLSGLLFVGVNLGATARGTKKWYEEKFGEDKVAKKWHMIPFLY
jgi:3-oxo-5-alpha-steroid 4-dehydrogenase 3